MSLPRTRVDGTTTSPEAPRDDVLLDDAGHPRGRDVLPWVFAGASIVGYLGWPFVTGTDRATLTIVTVTTFFLASGFLDAPHAAEVVRRRQEHIDHDTSCKAGFW